MITKGLIIDEPWLSKILKGDKDWEMRSTRSSHRGPFGLIRKGSGQVVGIAALTGVSGPFDNRSLEESFDRHRVGPGLYEKPEYKWRYAWQLSDVVRLVKPVHYQHKNGAVTWVELNAEAIAGIEKQMQSNSLNEEPNGAVDEEMARLFGSNGSRSSSTCNNIVEADKTVSKPFIAQPEEIAPFLSIQIKKETVAEHTDPIVTLKVESGALNISHADIDSLEGVMPGVYRLTTANTITKTKGVEEIIPGLYQLSKPGMAEDNELHITLTQGNINNAHFYIPRQTQMFPNNAWGGKNKQESGHPLLFEFDGIDGTVQTDIDSSKRILRSRGPIRNFFTLHNLSAGDQIKISRVAEREYKILTMSATV